MTATTVAETLEAATHLSGQLDRLTADNRIGFPLSAEQISGWNDDQRLVLYGYLFLFEQLQELIAKRALCGLLAFEAEDVAAMSARDVADRSEKLGIIESADIWRNLIKVRNTLAHDYPMDLAAQAERANVVRDAVPELLAMTQAVLAYAEKLDLTER